MKQFVLAGLSIRPLMGVFPCVIVSFIVTVSIGSGVEANAGQTIESLVAELKSDSFARREAASRALKERMEAIPALQKARLSPDLEVRRRVAEILSVLERKRASHVLTKAKTLGKSGRAVEVADRLALAAKYGVSGELGWTSLMLLAEQVVLHTDDTLPPGWKSYCNRQLPVGDFSHFDKRFHPKDVAKRIIEINTGKHRRAPSSAKEIADFEFLRENSGKLFLRGEEVSLMGNHPAHLLCIGMVAASGDSQITSAMNSIIVVGGDVKKVEDLMNCILICDGDVELLNECEAKCSIIIARGKVTYDKRHITLRDCLIRSGHALHLHGGSPSSLKTIDLKDGTPDPLAFLKFFELADVGIAAQDLTSRGKSDAEGVRLKDVRKESAFSAGLRAGDLITAVDEKKTPTTEIFRRVLRRRLAEGGPLITFSLQRSGKTLDVSIPIKD